jgi:non-ribosomal peptide synthetase component F
VNDPLQKIGKLKMLSDAETQKLLVEFNETKIDYPKDKSITELFEEYAEINPEKTALIYEQTQLTYNELNERSNQFANYLISKKIKSGTLIPVCIERSPEMIIAIFGILKSGCAYVPIDPEYPTERMQFMLEDTEAKIVVTSKKTRSKLPESDKINFIEIDTDRAKINKKPADNLKKSVKSGQLAYVIYTSGSTGKPKGVMIEHRGVVNLSYGQRDLLRLKPDMRQLQFASFGFDASCYEIFNTYLSGGCLVLCNNEDLSIGGRF